ncbi:hypothetical protein [Chroogloeocystis siderophila]|uniref:Uncharacterized protein n=1 Tax=Chroogloeocystis siderophila 5.2 s.c.1 TaxID=247279 RepID=A0A1U7HZM9_9CHRO|nr:hypothetical protein [Chroogloeocystis siderophila]OKH29094.1 hypothetical protein NIES1031_00345 [Chroogloeocystis siderophila 5.2 s.c.1]
MQQNTQLMEQEKLKSRIEQFRLEKNTLEGQISALTSQLERLEIEKRSPHRLHVKKTNTASTSLVDLVQAVQVVATQTCRRSLPLIHLCLWYGHSQQS